MKRSKSSQNWLKRHFDDPYVKQAKKAGYRSRAVFKLLEIQEKRRIIKPGQVIVDLGAAPGGWAQVAVPLVGKKGAIIALDILPIEPIEGVAFIQGDFAEQDVRERLLLAINGRSIDLVMSDMAPNISGLKAVDQPRAIYLAELALDFARGVLKPGGDFLVKVFQGEGFDGYLKDVRETFKKVVIRKPKASRPKSREVYLLAMDMKKEAEA
ncbi:MAG: 23S rRNA (uridine(2552)-2'-O)-methyltransferase RlmE [Gammaproteobacteria bacterium]|nr:23S rRNA (uridine(2552)-2'-O)-methyltransferase RlmE [Gammaproteobacteria bacterium]